MVGCGSVATAARLLLQPACPDKLGLGAGGREGAGLKMAPNTHRHEKQAVYAVSST